MISVKNGIQDGSITFCCAYCRFRREDGGNRARQLMSRYRQSPEEDASCSNTSNSNHCYTFHILLLLWPLKAEFCRPVSDYDTNNEAYLLTSSSSVSVLSLVNSVAGRVQRQANSLASVTNPQGGCCSLNLSYTEASDFCRPCGSHASHQDLLHDRKEVTALTCRAADGRQRQQCFQMTCPHM